MSNGDEKFSLLKRVAELTVLLAFYLYFAGWSYASELFASFGLSLNAIETPVYFFIVYAYRVFFASFFGIVLLLFLAGGWYVLALSAWSRRAELLFVGTLAILPFPGIHWLAIHAAATTASEIRSGHATTVTFTARPDAKYDPKFLDFIQNTTFFLITQTDETYYVFYQRPAEPGTMELPRAEEYDIPADDFVARKMLINTKEAP